MMSAALETGCVSAKKELGAEERITDCWEMSSEQKMSGGNYEGNKQLIRLRRRRRPLGRRCT